MNLDDDGVVRGILKSSGNYPQNSVMIKTAKFDELNVLETFHPLNKDYGHMVIDEPKTPFVFEEDLPRELDTETLMEKLRLAAQSETPAFGMDADSDDSSDDDDYPESVEEKVRRLEFERRRKYHYKEFFTVELARRLIAEEFADMTPSEISIPDEICKSSVESCSSEICPQYEDMSMSDQSILSNSLPTMNSDDILAPHPEPEPGFDPSHKCYQKLMAEIEATPAPAPLAARSNTSLTPSHFTRASRGSANTRNSGTSGTFAKKRSVLKFT